MVNVANSDSRINLSKATCLAVDDSAMALQVLSQVLSGFGIGRLLKSVTSSDAQRIAKENALDLIIIDGHMPNMDGYEFIQWLRREADNENRFVPILLLTGETRLSHVFRGRDCGANFVVAKPISPKVLLDRIYWMARDAREFIEAETYVGPDRRFKREGPPSGVAGRRRNDSADNVQGPERDLSVDDSAAVKIAID